jgi:ribosomal protein S12 methylthiotransferase accessory factor
MIPANQTQMVHACYSDLRGRAIAPSAFALLSDAQYQAFPRLEKLDESTSIDWCRGYSLTHCSEVLVPARLVYFEFARPPDAPFLPELVSTGTACHMSMTKAILNALCEVIERDAIAIAWLNRLPLRAIDTGGTAVSELTDGGRSAEGVDITLFDVPTDAPFPVVMALASRPGSTPSAVVGAACRPDRRGACEKAIFEACHLLYRFHGRVPSRPREVRTLDDHANFYAAPGGAELLSSSMRVGEPLRLGDTIRVAHAETADVLLAHAVRRLADRGLEVIAVDITPPDIAAAGFRIARVLVPGTVDINIDARFPRLGGERLYQLPVQLGLHESPVAEPELNTLPIPLA